MKPKEDNPYLEPKERRDAPLPVQPKECEKEIPEERNPKDNYPPPPEIKSSTDNITIEEPEPAYDAPVSWQRPIGNSRYKTKNEYTDPPSLGVGH